MKKSKIIVPALGLLLLSTAASVSGTVAWFTANRAFNTNAGNFAVVKTNTDLVCVMAGGIGTKLVDQDDNTGASPVYSNDSIALNETEATSSAKGAAVELTDASFDHDTKNVIEPDADGVKVGATKGLSDSLVRATYDTANTSPNLATTHTVYSALTWEMDFRVSYSAAAGNSGLFFDLSKTSFVKAADNGALTEAGKGFRLAFIPASGTNDDNNTYLTGNTRVLARGTTTGISYIDNATAGQTFVNDTDGTSPASYTAPILIDGDDTYTLPADNAASTSSLASVNAYLGKFVAEPAKTVHLKFTVVAWYEGTDPNVVNASALEEKVKANLAFELRTLSD